MNAPRATSPAVLLISPGIVRWTDLDFGLPHLVALGGYLRHHTGVRVEILDLNLEGGDPRSLARRIQDLGPLLLVGIAAYTSFDVLRVRALARFVAEVVPGVPLVAGGYHASALPEDLVGPGRPFDAVVRGEGERPMRALVERLLGGGELGDPVLPRDVVPTMDELPPYAWDLLDHYWPRAREVGRKLQIYLSRGCTYHCTFCMERAKSGYTWRAFSPERALDELERLGRKTDLSHWVVNLADPLFGFQRRWRKTVLRGILDRGIAPRQFWTLTRSDDLDEEDVELLARARFSIGIGMESGSPRMLKIMQKGNHPERYLNALRRLARLSREHGLNWAANVIVGHPGETLQSMQETHAFVEELFATASDTCGWVSIDPFRLYPGSAVHEQLEQWEAAHGARFFHPRWWESWYDGPFRAQHLDPSSELSFEQRVAFMYSAYPSLIERVQANFRGQGRSVDRVFERSLAEQRSMLSPARRDQLLALAQRAHQAKRRTTGPTELSVPLGLQMKNPWLRKREQAVRRLLDQGVLVTTDLVEALLAHGPEAYMPSDAADQVLAGRTPSSPAEGWPAPALSIDLLAAGLEALAPGVGDTLVDMTGASGWVGAIMAHLVGPEGQVLVRTEEAQLALPEGPAKPWVGSLNRWPELGPLEGQVDGVWWGAAVPRVPAWLQRLLRPEGRLIAVVGPRFRPQMLTFFGRREGAWHATPLRRVSVPIMAGAGGWLRERPRAVKPITVHVDAAAARGFEVFARADLGPDVAGLFDAARGPGAWSEAFSEAWHATPQRVMLQGELLLHDTADALLQVLRAPRGRLDTTEGRALCDAFLQAWEQVEAPEPPASRVDDAWPELQALRELLYAAQGAPPPLKLLHVPALGGRARATQRACGTRVVATDLAQPRAHVVLQVLHEEVHPITDPIVMEEWDDAVSRDTRPGTRGYALHQALESTAVAATEALLQQRAPDWMPAFSAWKTRVGA
ncbi:MAG: radical SAM protein [Myxococcota bacterium]